ncbi:peptidase S8 [Arachnia propionica]|uniref:Peptidase S8 n=1 Tax=Arachnia propionica TaxID=1750 RepID=A0A3P1T1G7_9ACTN|nr:S8 family serine peptidase [Arachnia propionica]RRD03337.1 peptidase S8 [Arachnia propionica]
MTTSTARPSRFVVVFDTADPARLDEVAPAALESLGMQPDHWFPRLGVAIVSGTTAPTLTLQEAHSDVDVAVLPETTYHAITAPQTGPDSYEDTDQATWGIQAVGAVDSPHTGKGIRIAVLDTGFNTAHPDFAGRTVVTQSFIDGEDAEDGHGHGTHCVGTAAGPRTWAEGRGYGVAPEAEIYVAKVLGNNGTGSDATILAGIDWALEQGCQVISMSLGADVTTVHPPYVAAGRRALEQGSLLIAAAGNNAARSRGNPGFVGAPANSPYVMAVGAVDKRLEVADFSAQALDVEGGEVNIAGPGVAIHSSWIAPKNYNTINGTSMATPHVAGVAALIAEATGARGQELWDQLVAGVRDLGLPKEDVGAGLVTAPQARTSSGTPSSWVVTLDDSHADRVEEVAAQLRAAGMRITRTLPRLGMIHGCTEGPCSVEELTGIDGVASVDVEVAHHITPPGPRIL